MNDYTWSSSGSGDWGNAADWTPEGGPPDSALDSAFIGGTNYYTVTVGGGENFFVNIVTLDAAYGTLDVASGGTLTLAGILDDATLTISAGSLDLAGVLDGGTILAPNGGFGGFGGTLEAVTFEGMLGLPDGSSELTLDGVAIVGSLTTDGVVYLPDLQTTSVQIFYGGGVLTLGGFLGGGTNSWVNNGTVSDAGVINVANYFSSGTLTNNAPGLIILTGDDAQISSSGDSSSLFINSGRLDGDDGSGISYVTTSLINSGTIFATSGTLDVDGGGTLGGTIGGGGGTVLLGGDFTLDSSPPTTVTFLPGASFSGAQLVGPGTLSSTGTVGIADLGADTGALRVGSGAIWQINGEVDDAGLIYQDFFDSGTIVTTTTSTFDLTTDDAAVVPSFDGGTLPFYNAGTLAKTGGTGTSDISGSIFNTGTIFATTGTLDVNGGGTLGGAIGGGGGTVLLGGDFTLDSDTPGTVTFVPGATFSAAALDGPGTLSSTGTVGIADLGTGTGAFRMGSAAVWQVAGEVDDAGLIYQYFFDSGTIVTTTTGTFDLTTDDAAVVPSFDGGTLPFYNAGTLAKTGGTGTSDISGSIFNTGTIFATTGTLDVNGGGTLGGAIGGGGGTVLLGGDFTLDSDTPGTVTFVPGATFSAAALDGPGTLSSTGTVGIADLGTGTGAFRMGSAAVWQVAGEVDDAGLIYQYFFDSGTIVTTTTGTFDLTTDDAAVVPSFDGGTLPFYNAGTLAKTGGAGTSDVSGGVYNAGTILADTGTLDLSGGGALGGTIGGGAGSISLSGNYTIAAGADTTLGGGSGAVSLAADVTLGGDTTTTIGGGASTVSLAGNFIFTGSTDSTIELLGGVIFSGEVFQGAVTLVGTGTVGIADLSYNNALVLGGGAVWQSDGTVADAGLISMYNNDSATIDIGTTGQFDLTTDDAQIEAEYSQVSLLVNNAGVLAKTGGAGTSAISTTIENSGTIIAASGTLDLTSRVTGGGTLVVAEGATLELDGPTDPGAAIQFGAGGGVLSLTDPAGVLGTIFNFTVGDTIDLPTTSYDPAGTATLLPGNTLQVVENGTTIDLNLDPSHDYTDLYFHTAPDGTDITVNDQPLCFLTDTLIATPGGEVPVQCLAPGDLVRTASGGVRPVVWVGKGHVLATRGRRNAATPVIVRKGALADNVPHHDLRVTRAHGLLLDGVLIPAEFLVNHRSIHWDDRAQGVTLYHVELDMHDVLLANGAPAESYRDDGNRWLFQNANTGWDLPAKVSCLPVVTGGPVVDAVWRQLLDRSGPRAGVPLTNDPDLHLVVDGRRVDACQVSGQVYSFALPAAPESVRIVCRAAVPAELGMARDPRCLGIAVGRVFVRKGPRFRMIEASDPALDEGFHGYEADNGYRWTTGDSKLPAAFFADLGGGSELVLPVESRACYVEEGVVVKAA